MKKGLCHARAEDGGKFLHKGNFIETVARAGRKEDQKKKGVIKPISISGVARPRLSTCVEKARGRMKDHRHRANSLEKTSNKEGGGRR